MAIKQLRPVTPAQRGMTTQDFSSVTTKRPVKSLIVIQRAAKGRNNQGRITTRHKGGGVKRFYRIIDFKLPLGTEAVIEHIEYDPNRSARIARIKDSASVYHYILAANGMKIGDKISVSEDASIDVGNRLPLKNIPIGSQIHSVELQPNKGAQLARSAGVSVQLMSKDNGYAQLKLPSGEVRLAKLECMASIGIVGNEQHQNIKIGKAGRNRYKGIRPSVRGVVMGAYDHPHGGGDGGRHGTGKDPRTPWGQKTLGYKTRRRKSTSNMIVRKRSEGKRK
ncbi:MAG TPA: 50S ribosomal protein L2 [Candidatus Saccharimonadia bacterium]|nr:50S ribosomal protein L2 [Candidatus Saccharimonadia bacterium]